MLYLFLVLFAFAFTCEYAAATLGMGYGTTLAPILIILGYEPLILVPAILFSQFFAGFIAAGFHHKFENMDLSNPIERTSLVIFGTTGIIGVLVSVLIGIGLSPVYVKIYIALTVMAVGLLTFLNGHRESDFSGKKLASIGIVAAFNKGISGGGYSPILAAGQMVCGIKPRAAIAITALVEGIICAVGVGLYWLLAVPIDVLLIVGITAGAVTAAPLSALTTKSLEQERLKELVAIAIVLVGLASFLVVMTNVLT